MNSFRKILYIAVLCCAALPLCAQNDKYRSYIERFAPLAVEQMELHNIPASITLAQGLLESGAGESMLAVKANNHFGIKTGGNWAGPYVLKTDDRPNERFRKYASVRESYEDHSRFLVTRSRYASLFNLSKHDYKGWAHGLRRCGYATNPRYGTLLIDLIERYELHQYDRHRLKKNEVKASKEGNKTWRVENLTPGRHALVVGRQNGVYYVTSRLGDTYEDIAREMKLKPSRLIAYNDLPRHTRTTDRPTPGTRLYLQKKGKRLNKKEGAAVYFLKSDDSLYTVAQRFGIRLDRLVKMNRGFTPNVGEAVRLR